MRSILSGELGLRGVSGIDFFQKMEITEVENPENVKKWFEIGLENCSWGLGTLGWIKIVRRIQWNASRTSKRP